MIEHTLVEKLVSRIPHYTYPVNEKAVKRESKVKHQPALIHQSAVFFNQKDEDGVVHLMKKGITYERSPNKALSTRDIHRNQVKEK